MSYTNDQKTIIKKYLALDGRDIDSNICKTALSYTFYLLTGEELKEYNRPKLEEAVQC